MTRPTSMALGLTVLAIARAASAATSPLLNGVTAIKLGGALPGPILIGDKVVPLIVATDEKGDVKGVAAALAPFGKGAMVAMGHEAFYADTTFTSQPGAKALLTNR